MMLTEDQAYMAMVIYLKERMKRAGHNDPLGARDLNGLGMTKILTEDHLRNIRLDNSNAHKVKRRRNILARHHFDLRS